LSSVTVSPSWYCFLSQNAWPVLSVYAPVFEWEKGGRGSQRRGSTEVGRGGQAAALDAAI
jgi:hypothetical protein